MRKRIKTKTLFIKTKKKSMICFLFIASFFINITLTLVNEDHYNIKGSLSHQGVSLHSASIEHVKGYNHDHNLFNTSHAHATCLNHSHMHFCDLNLNTIYTSVSVIPIALNSLNQYISQDLYKSQFNFELLRPPIYQS